jgi:gephyrin
MTELKLKAAVLIISDTAADDNSTDKTGPILHDVFNEVASEKWDIVQTDIVPDDILKIQRFIRRWTDSPDAINLIVTSGGTGFAVKDKTPEAVGPLIHKHAPGLVHGMLAASLEVTPFAMMSRQVAGVRNKTLIVTLPGSPKGAKENLEAIIKLLPHACLQAAGGDSRSIHAGGVKKLESDAGIQNDSPSQVSTYSQLAKNSQENTYDHSHGHCHGEHQLPVARTKPEDRPPQSNDPNAGPTRRYRKSPYPMLSVDQALKLIVDNTPAPKVVQMPFNTGVVGHVLAEDIKALESVPAFRASIVDGYAVRFPAQGVFERGVYPVAFASHAHAGNIQELKEGQIARITTGAPLPPGASAVIMVEDTILKTMTDDGQEEKEVEILNSDIKGGENVREIGSDVMKGDIIMRKGEGISANGGEFGLLASVGIRSITVYKKPVVGVMSTGDEIVEHNKSTVLQLGEVRDTNRPTLLTLAKTCGFQTVDLGIVSDQ